MIRTRKYKLKKLQQTRKLRKLKYDSLLNYIDTLDTLDTHTEIFIFNKNLPTNINFKSILLLLKYKFNYIPTINKLFKYNIKWISIFLEYLDIKNNPELLLNAIKNIELNDKTIKIIYNLCLSQYTKHINFSSILDYLIDQCKKHTKLINVINTILRKAKYNVNNYLDFFIRTSTKKNIKFATQIQLFDYIDKNKYVSSTLLNLNRHLFNNKELYDFLKNKQYIYDIYNYVIKNKKENNVELFEYVYSLNGRTFFKLIKYLNNNPELYKKYDIINKIELGTNKYHTSMNYKLFCILAILDDNYYNGGNNLYYGHLYTNNDFNTYCTLNTILNTFIKYISYSHFLLTREINNRDRISNEINYNLNDVFKFCIYIAAKNSSSEQIYSSLENIVKIIDSKYQYKNNPTFKLLHEMLQILINYL
jgi:hypothetical protein